MADLGCCLCVITNAPSLKPETRANLHRLRVTDGGGGGGGDATSCWE